MARSRVRAYHQLGKAEGGWEMQSLLVVLSALTLNMLPIACAENEEAVETAAQGGEGRDVEITVVFDNYPSDARLQTSWGFACVIRGLEKTVLFDTGGNGGILLNNMRTLGIDPAEIEIVVLSHVHMDHIGGLQAFLRENGDVTVYMPASFPDGIGDLVRGAGGRVVAVDEPLEIFSGFHSTGEMGEAIREQGVFFRAADGLVVVTGCAHPGVAEMAARAAEVGGEAPYLVIGGFHLGRTDDATVGAIIERLQNLGVRSALPTHCTGDRARQLFRQALGDGCIEGGLGTTILVPVSQ